VIAKPMAEDSESVEIWLKNTVNKQVPKIFYITKIKSQIFLFIMQLEFSQDTLENKIMV